MKQRLKTHATTITPVMDVMICADQDTMGAISCDTIVALQADPALLRKALVMAFTGGKYNAHKSIRASEDLYMSMLASDMGLALETEHMR